MGSLADLGLEVRPVEAGDVEALRRMFFRLTPRTVYLRFFQPIHVPSDRRLRYLAGVDHQWREALAAVQHDGEIVAVARYDRLQSDPTRAEVAVLVEDAWQGHAVGPLLLRELTRRARRNGVHAFVASVLGENRHMLEIVHAIAGSDAVHSTFSQGAWDIEVPVGSAAV